MREWSITVVWMVLTLAAAWRCALTGRRNLAAAAAARGRAPLEPDEVAAGNPPASSTPTSWPGPATLADPVLAAAYRDYARERRETWVLWGEVVVLAASAALGASVAGVLRGGWHTWPFVAALLAGVFGVVLKRSGEQKWTHIAVLYARRVTALRRPPAAEPAPPPAEAPPSWWRRVLRLLLGGQLP